MRIAWLRDHPWHIEALAAGHLEAFGALIPDWDIVQAIAELRSHTRGCAIPTTLIALDDAGTWLGSVSLLQEDHEHIRQYSPWLATLYVRPAARGQGVGSALVARCVAEAAALQVAELYLYCTTSMADWYRALGWHDHDIVELGPLQVRVMAIRCAAVAT
ncbi:GNAT family N-acetyltransferase [Pseudoxanthomonas daejeonensis]|uniref:GNAT family N-acetyltransferase n=1 Tax=Pseudoxanthomonas daejeonensis TaxID=266062 RepID=A0ABQ6ZBI4_9GAMM|nr:GNAT family N-acetyltransferase [Pseudoxanthomonas daejeonensis]KAF1696901.1 GNAT family N-acetyltransferase [Pseudoxanthomonas daejeonensis]